MESRIQSIDEAERAARRARGCRVVNVGNLERIASAMAGGGLIAAGLYRRDLMGVVAALAGGGLVFRGASGHCMLYRWLGWNTAVHPNAAIGVPVGQGMKLEPIAVDK